MVLFGRWTKGLSLSRSSTLSDDIQDIAATSDPPTLSQLYGEAAEFEKVLAKSGCIDCRHSHKDGSNGFADLVGHDLSRCEQAVADRVNKLSVSRLYTDDVLGSSNDNEDTLEVDGTQSEPPSPIINRVVTEEEEPWQLDPPEIISLLIDEFGPLTTEGEDEKLLLETDGCLILDVFIIGVIHVTTHRIAFHASLLESDSDVPSSKRMIKTGPAVLHRKGWRAKRRICDEGRLRPFTTILFAFIKKVHPINPQRSRFLHIELNLRSRDLVDAFEFDTEESARDWYRELTGALFMYRHQRRVALDTSIPEEEAGIRLSLPLNRVARIRFGCYPEFPFIASLLVQSLPLEDSEEEDAVLEQETIHIGTIRPTDSWKHLERRVEIARHRLLQRPLDQFPVFIDFGPLTFHESQLMPHDPDVPWIKEVAIREALALGPDETHLWVIRARIYRNISSTGYLVLTNHFLCFWSKTSTSDIKYRIPLLKIQAIQPFNISICLFHGLTIIVKNKLPLKLVFKNSDSRDDAQEQALAALDRVRFPPMSITTSTLPRAATMSTVTTSTSSTMPESTVESLDSSGTPKSASFSATSVLAPLSRTFKAVRAVGLPPYIHLRLPKAINLPREMLPKMPSMHFVCLTIGSRGDVQPYIALGLGLMKEGHRVTIVTHEEYREWILSFNIGHRTAGGDPGALMKLSVENKMFSPEFFKESLTKFRPWLDQLLLDAWKACHDADVLLESPSAMAGVHIAEALSIPYFRTFTMPWTKTTEFPHAFLSPPVESPAFNSASYVLFSNVLWTATSRQINRWRRQVLKISNTDMGHLAQSKIITIYNFSQAVVSKPLDWGDITIISGYWFLDNPDLDWSPPQALLDFMVKARTDGKPLVYIGFGSITVPNPASVTDRLVKAVVQSDVRAIICKGWSTRMSKAANEDNTEIPPECYMLDRVPHDWLFPQVDAALHHGGAGTTGASLRAGIPTLIKPWFGDQFFWAARVHRLGAGLRVSSLRVSDLVHALKKATSSPVMKEKAAAVGEKIRSEDGVRTAIHTIYTYLPRAARDRTSLD
ncbi:Sterol 3-beta-glucosyltransferase [Termitomyces sp. T112]|nr:Sterol 3-beta-glucosyltransferase [Termitomyces sp. T112]